MRKEGNETTVMSGYVKRLCGGKIEDKFYRLLVNKTLYIYGAHQVTIEEPPTFSKVFTISSSFIGHNSNDADWIFCSRGELSNTSLVHPVMITSLYGVYMSRTREAIG